MPAPGALAGVEDIEPCGAAAAWDRCLGNTCVKVGWGRTCGCTSPWVARRTSSWAAQAAWPGAGAAQTLTAVTCDSGTPAVCWTEAASAWGLGASARTPGWWRAAPTPRG